ncbi:MAG: TOBE domain-containing protein [Kineosporiaceae bacterium]
MATFRMRQAASLLGLSEDTLRRWAEAGRLSTVRDPAGRQAIEGAELARLAQDLAGATPRTAARPVARASARNRLTGLVTKVVKDGVMAQVELQAGPFRIVSLMSREAADDLGLAPGVLAVASVKSTNVVVEIPES